VKSEIGNIISLGIGANRTQVWKYISQEEILNLLSNQKDIFCDYKSFNKLDRLYFLGSPTSQNIVSVGCVCVLGFLFISPQYHGK
jgi:hypothetical protein